jgi:hypothetical protein
MCYNKEASISVFTYVTVATGLLWYRNYPNDRMLATVFFGIGLVQLFEYFLWAYPGCNLINHYATIAIALLIVLHPTIIFSSAYAYENTVIPKNYLLIPIILGCIGFIYNAIRLLTSKRNFCSKGTKNDYMEWDINLAGEKKSNNMSSFVIWMLYFIPLFVFLFMKNRTYGIIIFAVLFIGLLFSMHKARFLASVQSDSWRSVWCFVSNSLPVVALGLGYYFYKNKKVDKI